MAFSKKSVLGVLLLGLFFTACTKDEVDETPILPASGEFRFTANGWPVIMEKTVAATENANTAGDCFTLHAAGAAGYVASGGIYRFNGPGTYDLGSDSAGYIHFTINGSQYTMGSIMQSRSSGSITVSEMRTKGNYRFMKGTFAGTAYANNGWDSVRIENGTFTDQLFNGLPK
ncbi:MAG: DUF6252 family protein [Bacteroidia bacterium]|jgi:hypothetical protein